MREIKFRAWVRHTTDNLWEYAYKKAESEKLEYDVEKELRDIYFEEWSKNNSEDKRFSHREYMTNLDEVKISLRGNTTTLIALEVLSIMQYTGLHDKHGNEIYEGDLLRVKSQYETVDPIDSSPNKVYFRDGAFRCGFHDMLLNEKVCTGSTGNWNMEIIGNIYENPELMKP